MGAKKTKEYCETTNNYVYNKSRKLYLEALREIDCSRCGYHYCENNTDKFYEVDGRKPNWKLVTKNKKQWMKKKYKIREHYYNGYKQSYFEIVV